MKHHARLAFLAFACCSFGIASADGAHGKIKICRIPLPGSSTSAVYLPPDGLYGPACDGDPAACRKFTISATAAGTLPAGAASCATIEGVLMQDDGQPVTAGQALIAQWSTGSLVSRITVAETFH